MTLQDLIDKAPQRRFKPKDRVAVTAELWEESHDYHRRQQQLQAMVALGSGIVTGLQVFASTPPDSNVHIKPGIAIDPEGRTLVVREEWSVPVDNKATGDVHVLLEYEDGPAEKDRGDNSYHVPEFVVERYRASAPDALPGSPCIELARIRRTGGREAIRDARGPGQPGPNEIDLRFRHVIGAPQETRLAVTYLSDTDTISPTSVLRKYGGGAASLARSLNHDARFRVWVDEDVPIGPGIDSYALIYLVAQGHVDLQARQRAVLAQLLRRERTTVFVESADADSAALDDCQRILEAIDVRFEPLQPGHRLLVDPYLFAELPPGHDPGDVQVGHIAGDVRLDHGVILSRASYGRLWQGESYDGPPPREQIRAALEWGGNLVAYARDRHNR